MPFLTMLFGWVTTFLASGVARFAAWKIILTVVVLSIFPILLNNFLYEIIGIVYAAVNTHGDTGSISPIVVQASGLFAWFLDRFRVPEAMSLWMSAYAFKFALGLIPFVRV